MVVAQGTDRGREPNPDIGYVGKREAVPKKTHLTAKFDAEDHSGLAARNAITSGVG